MYRSDEEKKKKKKNSNTQDLQSVEVLLRADFVGSAFFSSPTNKSEGKKYSRTHTVAPPWAWALWYKQEVIFT